MKIFIVGALEDRPEALESSYARAFSKLGHQVFRWDPVQALAQNSRGWRVGEVFSRFVEIEPWSHKANLEFLALTHDLKPDLILVIATSGVNAGTLAQIKVVIPDTRIYSIYPDTPHNLVSNRIQCLPLFDRVIVYAKELVDMFGRMGARHVVPLGFAADPDLHQPYIGQGHDDLRSVDVSFIGNWRPEREAFLEQLADFNLLIWGSSYWNTRTRPRSPLRKRWAGHPAKGIELARAVATSKISLNILGPISWPGPNMRTFELPACEAFVLSERQPGVMEYFKEDFSITCYSSLEDARKKIDYYLHDEVKRKRIARAGYETVIHGGNTYLDRATTIVRWLEQDNTGA